MDEEHGYDEGIVEHEEPEAGTVCVTLEEERVVSGEIGMSWERRYGGLLIS